GGLARLLFIALSFLLWRNVFHFFGRLFGFGLPFELGFQIATAQLAPIEVGIPAEGGVANHPIVTVGAVNGVHHQWTILHRAADGTEFIHAPRKSHGSGSRNKSESRTQTGGAAASTRRRDG